MEQSNIITELKSIFKDAFFEDWMDAEDWNEFEKEFLKSSNISYEEMEKDIKKGLDNGHSLQYQLELVKEILSMVTDQNIDRKQSPYNAFYNDPVDDLNAFNDDSNESDYSDSNLQPEIEEKTPEDNL